MSGHDDNQPDELVTRAFAALRHFSVPEGPSPEAIALTVSAATHAANRPQSALFTRMIQDMPLKYKALMATGTLAATLVFALLLLLPGKSSLALEEVVNKLRSAQRISFVVEQNFGNPVQPMDKTRVWLAEPDMMRTEFKTPNQSVTVIRNGHRLMQLDATKKTAMVADFEPGELGSDWQALKQLRSLAEKDARSLGEKTIDGIRAKGFEVTVNGRMIIVWANVEGGEPIRLEYPLTEIPPPRGPGLQILTDFKFDEPFDPKLFSLTAPPDYEVSGLLERALLPMDHMLAILRMYSQKMAGGFPPRIDDQGRTIRTDLEVPPERNAMNTDQKQLVKHLEGIEFFLKAAKAGRHFQYFPGVKLGNKDRIVFWCVDPPTPIMGIVIPLIPRPDAGSPAPPKPIEEKYLAVYGDLRVEKLDEDQLPAPGSEKNDADK